MSIIKKVHDRDIALLCHQFSLILKSGIHPVEGIPILMEDTQNPSLKKALQSIAQEAMQGVRLYECFERAKVFPGYMVAMIKVGETTGMLETVMDSLSRYYENEADMRKKIRSSVSYPIVLAVLIAAVIALITLKVIPMFIEILTSLGGEIPGEVYLFMALGNSLKDGFAYVIAALVLLIAVVFILGNLGPVKNLYDRIKLRNPITGHLYKKITATRFSSALSLTLKNGMSLMEGFGVIIGIIENRYARKQLKEVALDIHEGSEFSDAIKNSRLFPGLFVRLTKTGEKTGSLDEMMGKIAEIYQEEVDTSLKRIISYIEPVCVTVLTLILAGVLLSVILPLINIMSSIG